VGAVESLPWGGEFCPQAAFLGQPEPAAAELPAVRLVFITFGGPARRLAD